MATEELDARFIERLLGAVGAHLASSGATARLLVVGGAALSLRYRVPRTTNDVDVIAMQDSGSWTEPVLSDELTAIIRRVARDFDVGDEHWLNVTVGSQWKTGMPEGFEAGIEWRRFGGLHVGLASRQTMISLKLLAAVDQGPSSVHGQDLAALRPTNEEIEAARRRAEGQDLNERFPQLIQEVIEHVRRRR